MKEFDSIYIIGLGELELFIIENNKIITDN